jgi:hypothetical protein
MLLTAPHFQPTGAGLVGIAAAWAAALTVVDH